MHHYIETTHPLVHRSTIWLKTFVGQIFTVLNIIHKNLTTLQTTPFSCNRCGLWPEFWEFVCVQWQGIIILVVQRRYWSCWHLCTEIRSFSIAFANVEVKNVLEELVGNRRQGCYIKLWRHDLRFYDTNVVSTYHHFNTKLACHHDCTFHWNYNAHMLWVCCQTMTYFVKFLPMANLRKLWIEKILAIQFSY